MYGVYIIYIFLLSKNVGSSIKQLTPKYGS